MTRNDMEKIPHVECRATLPWMYLYIFDATTILQVLEFQEVEFRRGA